MLRGIRTASANWLGKIVMGVVVGILALSFAIWGIGDIFRGSTRTAVASVGGTEISAETFRNIYNERMQQISQQLGRPIPPDQARALGIDRQILAQLVSDTALDEWGRRMGLGITDNEVARLIRSIPAFHGADGQFDHALFVQRIRAAGYTEPRFIAEQRRVMIRQHLTDSIGGVTVVPKTYKDAVNSYQNEQRSIEFVVLGPAQAGDIPAPTAEELAAYFEKNKGAFRAPEYRKLVILKLTSGELRKWITVSDEDARAYYEGRRSLYTTPGRRHIQQIIFPNEEEAKRAKARIDAGTPFVEIAKERGLSEQDIDLGFVARGAFATAPAVADAAFSTPEGGVSAPVQSRLGFALLRVVKAEPDTVRPFAEVAEEIKTAILSDRTRTELGQRHDKIEDERSGGANLTEVAQKVGLSVTVIDAVDRQGRDPGGAAVIGLPTEMDVLGPAFAAAAKAENEALRTNDGGYIWFEVAEIIPSKERTLDEVKERVEARWREEKIVERLRAKAQAMIEKLKAGAAFAEVAGADTLKVETAADLRRTSRTDAVAPSVVSVVFRTAKGGFAIADGQNASQQVVFRVTDVTTPPLDPASAEARRLDDTLRNAMSEDFLRQYIVHIERAIGTTINLDALRRAIGGES